MASLLERKLIVVTGKGGAGKTTVACALGLLAARRGLRTIVVELGDQHRMPELFGHSQDTEPGVEVALEEGLWSTSIDPEQALMEWLRTLGGRISVRMLAASSTFQYFAAAAPGAKELVSMVKLRELCERQGSVESAQRENRRDSDGYDLVVLDAPATGHALAMLRSPQTFATIVRVGPLAEQARGVRELLEDPQRSAYVAVAQGTEMAVSETLELEEGLRRHLDRDLDAVIVNGVAPRRFTKQELTLIEADNEHPPAKRAASGSSPARSARGDDAEPTGDALLAQSAARTARAAYARSRVQQSQIARLRRQRFADGMPPGIATIPFVFARTLDLAAVQDIAAHLERRL
jgi:anion-transporting  ArsA/GET3 family ATPase